LVAKKPVPICMILLGSMCFESMCIPPGQPAVDH
jgi:hypothetical protein